MRRGSKLHVSESGRITGVCEDVLVKSQVWVARGEVADVVGLRVWGGKEKVTGVVGYRCVQTSW